MSSYWIPLYCLDAPLRPLFSRSVGRCGSFCLPEFWTYHGGTCLCGSILVTAGFYFNLCDMQNKGEVGYASDHTCPSSSSQCAPQQHQPVNHSTAPNYPGAACSSRGTAEGSNGAPCCTGTLARLPSCVAAAALYLVILCDIVYCFPCLAVLPLAAFALMDWCCLSFIAAQLCHEGVTCTLFMHSSRCILFGCT